VGSKVNAGETLPEVHLVQKTMKDTGELGRWTHAGKWTAKEEKKGLAQKRKKCAGAGNVMAGEKEETNPKGVP